MLQLNNRTPFAGTIYLLPDPDGIDTLYGVVKATFTIGAGTRAQLEVADEQQPIVMAPEYHGEPGTSSIRRPSDISLMKPGTDVLVLGHAWAPGGRPEGVVDVAIAAGPIRAFARVFGDRQWVSSGAGYAMTEPQPVQRMPLVWERAYGGRDRTGEGPAEEPRNPVGVGFRARDGLDAIDGTRLPNIEDPAALIGSWKDRPEPVGFGPIDAFWEPRRGFAGTYDAAWQRDRAPYLPADFDPRFLQLAPPRLVAPGHLRGGEWFDLRGFTPDSVLQFQVPALSPRVTFDLAGSPETPTVALDTVLVEPDERRLTLLWRAALPVDKKGLCVREAEFALAEAA